jgi:hypothetical protein
MSGMRQDTMKHVDMDKSLSNKERFDRLKESRQKYKDEAARQREEARSANEKVELLEKQLQMLVAQVEAGEETKASEPTQSSKANGTGARRSNRRADHESVRVDRGARAAKNRGGARDERDA